MTSKKNKPAPDVRTIGSGPASFADASNQSNQHIISLADIQAELDKKWSPRRKQAEDLIQVYKDIGEYRRAFKLSFCGTYLEFAVGEDGKSRLHSANFCRDRLCPLCSWRRSLKLFSQLSSVLNASSLSGYDFIALTLSYRSVPSESLPGAISHLLDSWHRLTGRVAFKSAFHGWYRALEITFNPRSGTFHPHLHVILVCRHSYFKSSSYLSHADFVSLWRDVGRVDYDPAVYLQRIGKSSSIDAKSIAEVSLMDTKTRDLDLESMYSCKETFEEVHKGLYIERLMKVEAFLRSLANRRLSAFGGILLDLQRQLFSDDAEDGDLVHTDGFISAPVAQLIVRYHWRFGAYVSDSFVKEVC